MERDLRELAGARVAASPWVLSCERIEKRALPSTSTIRRIAVGLAGGAVTFVGVAMLVLPGPAIIVIPLGLAILAAEFEWARRWIVRFRRDQGPSAPSKYEEKVARPGDDSPRD